MMALDFLADLQSILVSMTSEVLLVEVSIILTIPSNTGNARLQLLQLIL